MRSKQQKMSLKIVVLIFLVTLIFKNCTCSASVIMKKQNSLFSQLKEVLRTTSLGIALPDAFETYNKAYKAHRCHCSGTISSKIKFVTEEILAPTIKFKKIHDRCENSLFQGHFKSYLCYKMITSQNVTSEAQDNNFFYFLEKLYSVPIFKFYQICNVMSISK